MPFTRSVFHRLLEPLDRRLLKRLSEAHNSDRGVGHGDRAWTSQRHLKAMLFAQFADLRSLREIEQALSARPCALYHLGLRRVSRTTLSDASSRRPAAFFRDICATLMAQATRKLRREGEALIQILDASPIQLRDERYGWALSDRRCRGLKIHLLLDPRAQCPVHFAVTSPKVSDIAGGWEIPIEAGATYVFDKGYTDYSWWQEIHTGRAIFVTRLKKNVHRRDIRENDAKGESILEDRRLKIGHKKPRGGAINPLYDTELREVIVTREGKDPLHLITNDHQASAEDIAALYKERWQIELFFKWIKQNLKIKAFLGRSENAVKIQIYTAIIAFLLLRMLQQGVAASHHQGAKALMTRIKVALFGPLDLTNKAKPPPKQPAARKPDNQLTLNIG